MASYLSILKSVLNINHNYIHVSSCEKATVNVHRYGETYKQIRIHVHARPYARVQKLCPICKKKCPGYDTKYNKESLWRAPNLNGVPVYICYQPKRIECPEQGEIQHLLTHPSYRSAKIKNKNQKKIKNNKKTAWICGGFNV